MTNIPNPYGKKGSPEHVNLVNEVAKEVRKKGLIARIEYFIRLITGRRYIDVAGVDAFTNAPKEFHQIGKQNKNQSPVKRERTTM